MALTPAPQASSGTPAPSPAGMIGAAGATGLLGMFDSWLNRRAARRNIRAQNQWNLEQWHRENQYNHPAQQLQRLKEAGLNAQLMYGSMGSAGNASHVQPSSQEVPPFAINAPAMIDAAGAMQSLRNARAQEQLIEEQRNATEALVFQRNAARQFQDAQRLIWQSRNQRDAESHSLRLQLLANRNAALSASTRYMNARRNQLKLDTLLKGFDVKLQTYGVTRNDSILLRSIIAGDSLPPSEIRLLTNLAGAGEGLLNIVKAFPKLGLGQIKGVTQQGPLRIPRPGDGIFPNRNF